MFDSHPPFQIDGNFGFTSGVIETIVQSHEEGLVRILPALPPSWRNGSVSGIKARNGIELDVIWNDGLVSEVRVRSMFDQEITFHDQRGTHQYGVKEEVRRCSG